jgi:hypothetical protein
VRSKASLVVLLTTITALGGCSETRLSQSQRSLERSGAVAFVCLNPSAEENPGRSIHDCPDFDVRDEDRDLFALVTQTLRGEVAVISLDAAAVLDSDPLVPGNSFLPVGENPVDIVATPGGTASFVAVAGGPGQNGIFGLPSSCIFAPDEGEAPRDLVIWPSCSLPSAPGRLTVLIDPPNDAGEIRPGCDFPAAPPEPGGGTSECEADLSLETSPPGRRKLAVTMPELGELWVLDAQQLLDLEPGVFGPCPVDRKVGLEVEQRPEDLRQMVPPDQQTEGGCIREMNYGPMGGPYFSRPSDLEVEDEVLYLGDLGAPVVHRLDVSDPCAIVAQPALFPLAYEEPGRTIFTSSLAVSPLTTKKERFVYAVDDAAGSVMVFDVSPDSVDRTPILRPGASLLPFETPDRLRFGAPAKDVEFVYRDLPAADSETGVAVNGILCDPDPLLDQTDPDSLAIEYRTAQDYSSGARPGKLRGTFGFIALTNGNVAIVDVEDFDAACRRPLVANPSETEDFRGCSGDPELPGGLYTVDGTLDGDRTTSGEQSCRVVEPHRMRSANVFLTSGETGIGAPALRTFPQLRDAEGRSLPTNQTDEGLEHPKLLAVDYPEGAAEVRVGTTLYRSDLEENRLDTDPTVAERNSLTFVLRQPRAFMPADSVGVVYEGLVVPERDVAFLEVGDDTAVLRDGGGVFCDRGVEDLGLAREVGGALDAAQLEAFARWHADYVQITAELPGEDDRYWDLQSCGDAGLYYACEDLFGTPEEPQPSRDLTILEAYQDRLVVTPRSEESQEAKAELLRRMDCCFGGEALSYAVRGGRQWIMVSSAVGFQHNVVAASTDTGLRCVRDCNPRRSHLGSRVQEIAADIHVDPGDDTGIEPCGAGECLACVMDDAGAIATDSPCVFESITTRFAIYRGAQRSQRDMAFTWEYSGGFEPLVTSIAASTTSVSPQRMHWFPQSQDLVITDGASQGLVFVELDTIGIRRYFF